ARRIEADLEVMTRDLAIGEDQVVARLSAHPDLSRVRHHRGALIGAGYHLQAAPAHRHGGRPSAGRGDPGPGSSIVDSHGHFLSIETTVIAAVPVRNLIRPPRGRSIPRPMVGVGSPGPGWWPIGQPVREVIRPRPGTRTATM